MIYHKNSIQPIPNVCGWVHFMSPKSPTVLGTAPMATQILTLMPSLIYLTSDVVCAPHLPLLDTLAIQD